MNIRTRKYPDGSEYPEYVIYSKDSTVTIDPQGAYVTSWNKAGRDILYIGSSKKRTGIPLLFPYFGTSKNGRQHGFGRDSEWKLVKEAHSSITLRLTDKDIDETAKKEYPYEFSAETKVSIDETGSMIYSLSVKNPSQTPIPISPGLHPYWAVSHVAKKSVKTNIPGFNAMAIDWDKNPPDNDFVFNNKAEIGMPGYKILIEDISKIPAVRQMVIWSQTPDKPDSNFICFEPVCGIRGGIDKSPIIINGGLTWVMSLKLTVAP